MIVCIHFTALRLIYPLIMSKTINIRPNKVPCHDFTFFLLYRPVSGHRPREKQKYNSRYSVTALKTSMFARQQLETATQERCFPCGPCRDVISRTVGARGVLWDSRKPVRTRAWKQMTLLVSVTRLRLMKTDWEDLVRVVVNCRLCELAISL
jgi:hypothetical protein